MSFLYNQSIHLFSLHLVIDTSGFTLLTVAQLAVLLVFKYRPTFFVHFSCFLNFFSNVSPNFFRHNVHVYSEFHRQFL